MSSQVYLTVEPSEVQFLTELGKQLTTHLQLSNNTDNHVAFKVKTTEPKIYSIRPNHGVVMPRSICDITVTMQAQKEFPEDLQCKDKFLLQSAITISGDIDLRMFDKDLGYDIQECKLRAVYVSPLQPPSPLAEGYDEVSLSSTPVSDDENSNTSDPISISKSEKEPQRQNSEIMKPGLQPTNAGSESIEKLLLREIETDKPRPFSYEDLIGFTSNLTAKVGSGAFGIVYKGQFPNGVEIAVKVLKENEFIKEENEFIKEENEFIKEENEFIKEEFMAEVTTMGRTSHRNLVKLYGFCFEDRMKALVYEYASNGSLDHVLYENRFNLKWEKLYDIAVQTAKALMYLHEGCVDKIIHYDIKPANVILDSNYSPKITDFGLAKLMSRDISCFIMTSFRGTRGFAAPETWTAESEITYKCDVYSFGMMLFEILGRRRNANSNPWFPKQVWLKFEKGELDEIIKDCNISEDNKVKARILSLVSLWCIQHTPERRPKMGSVANMLESEIQVTAPPNPFHTCDSILSMEPAPRSQ